MKEKVLIIRSVSFQQLDQNLVAIEKQFPLDKFELHLLTHGHGMERARTYRALSGIFDYEHRGNFSLFNVPAILKEIVFNSVIVPVTNKTGLGFLNVLALAARIHTRKILLCNMVSELREISRTDILWQGFKSILFSLLAGLVTVLMAVVTAPYLLIRLMFRTKREK